MARFDCAPPSGCGTVNSVPGCGGGGGGRLIQETGLNHHGEDITDLLASPPPPRNVCDPAASPMPHPHFLHPKSRLPPQLRGGHAHHDLSPLTGGADSSRGPDWLLRLWNLLDVSAGCGRKLLCHMTSFTSPPPAGVKEPPAGGPGPAGGPWTPTHVCCSELGEKR